MSAVTLQAGGATDVGRLRTVNQDTFVLLSDRDLFVVADGMGGHQGGEVASRLAVETLQVAYRDPSTESLSDAIAVANHRIRLEGDSDPELRGMGTTVVALALMPAEPDPTEPGSTGDDDPDRPERQHLVVANVGDSRAYLFRDGSLTQITEDHSVVADMVRDGRISAEEAEVHPQRNIVTRVLGVYETVEVDLWPVDPITGDRYLLCSDGLFNEVGLDQIGSVLRRLADPDEAAAELVRLANEEGGRDNITVVVVDVVDDGGVARSASRALAGEASGLVAAPGGVPRASDDADLAGFRTALDDPDPEPSPAHDAAHAVDDEPADRTWRGRWAARRADRLQRTRITWRVLAFLVLLAAVLGGAVATIQWYGTSAWFVGFDDDEVVIYRGRPGGILWIDPEVVERTGIDRADVAPRDLPKLRGVEQPSRADAEQVVDNIARTIAEQTRRERTTTTTTTTTIAGPTTSTEPP